MTNNIKLNLDLTKVNHAEPAGLPFGKQVAYIPDWAYTDQPEDVLNHDSVQFGFVTGLNNNSASVFIRYWNKQRDDLRTKANSEGTPIHNVYIFSAVSQTMVSKAIKEYGIEPSQFQAKS